MKVNYTVLQERISDGLNNNVIFHVNSLGGFESEQMELLRQLIMHVRRRGLNVHQAVLAFEEEGELKFFGSRNLVAHLSEKGLPVWTHSLTLT